jgi:hypothetical protein
LNVLKFGEIVEFKGLPSLNSFEESLTFFHSFLHVLDGEGLEEFVDLERKTLPNIGHKRCVGVVGAVHGVAGLIFGHKVVEHDEVRGDYGKRDCKLSEI